MMNRVTVGLSTLAMVLGGAGCASNVSTPESVRAAGTNAGSSKTESATSFQSVKTAVEFERDAHLGARTAKGPEIKYLDPERNKMLDGYNIYHIRGFDIGRSGQDVTDFAEAQIRVRQASYGDWPQYRAAYSQGEQFELTRIDSDVSCIGTNLCEKTEIVGINMTMAQLRTLAEREILAFKVMGSGNAMVIEIPQSYVQGFLAAVDERGEQ